MSKWIPSEERIHVRSAPILDSEVTLRVKDLPYFGAVHPRDHTCPAWTFLGAREQVQEYLDISIQARNRRKAGRNWVRVQRRSRSVLVLSTLYTLQA